MKRLFWPPKRLDLVMWWPSNSMKIELMANQKGKEVVKYDFFFFFLFFLSLHE